MKMLNFFKRNTQLYAVHHGTYAGEFWVLVKKDDKKMYFLATPTMINREVDIKTFESGKSAGVIDFVENLPIKIYNVCVKQFEKNEKLTK